MIWSLFSTWGHLQIHTTVQITRATDTKQLITSSYSNVSKMKGKMQLWESILCLSFLSNFMFHRLRKATLFIYLSLSRSIIPIILNSKIFWTEMTLICLSCFSTKIYFKLKGTWKLDTKLWLSFCELKHNSRRPIHSLSHKLY